MISVVLPTYNGADYLRESIDSILHQTIKDWELIIVDDCSTDDTLSIAQKYAESDERIRVIHNKTNQKLPKSLNIGFSKAKGQYLTWTSDDNRYLPEAFEKMKKALETHPQAAFICARVYVIDSQGRRKGTSFYPHSVLPSFQRKLLAYHDTLGACFLYRRVILDRLGGYDDSLFCVEDYEYWLRIVKNGYHIEAISDFLYEYRFHDKSLTLMQQNWVKLQRQRLRKKYLSFILDELKRHSQYLTCLFLEMLCQDKEPLSLEEKEQFYYYAPWLERIKPIPSQKTYIIYGAGNYGKRLHERLSSSVVCFADENTALAGIIIQGVPVLSVGNAKKQFPDAWFIIAANTSLVYGMIQTLQKCGIAEYSYFDGNLSHIY